MPRLLAVLLLALALMGCQSSPTTTADPTTVPTATLPVPVVIAETPTVAVASPVASATLAPSASRPAGAEATATLAPSATTVPPATALPTTPVPPAATATEVVGGATSLDQPAAIWIQSPGPGSTVVSPIRLSGEADTTFEQNLVVRVVSMDGRELALTPTQIQTPMGQRGPFSVEVPFSVSSETPALIQVMADSPRDGGIIRLASTVVTLLPSGSSDIRPGPPNQERILIQSPTAGSTVSGGTVTVSGRGIASFEQTLVADLLDVDGNTLARRPITVNAPDLGQPGTFTVTLPYTIGGRTPARVVVRDSSPANGATTHLSSVEITLTP